MKKTISALWLISTICFMPHCFAGNKKSVPAYTPGLGELMTSIVQPHHIKLGLAGQASNWPLADYELDELKEAFDTVVQYHSNWHKKPIAQMRTTLLQAPLSSLKDSIKAHDSQKFMTAYTGLTNACNACHQANERPYIVIKVPNSSPFPNQEFQPR